MHVHGQVLAAAERAAHPGQRQPDLLRRQAERRADLPLVHVQPLGGDVQVDAAVLGRHGQPGLRAEERLVLHADLVLAGDHDVGHRVRVALAQLQVPHQVARRVQLGPLLDSSLTSRGACTRFHRGWPRASWASVTGS